MITVNTLCQWIEESAPLSLQESYDNAGLQVGDPAWEITGVLIAIDVTEAVIQEAVQKHCNCIVAHHPLLFKGLKQITGRHYVERCVMAAIENHIAIYAAHTNLDATWQGVSNKMAEKLHLENKRILSPVQHQLLKLVTFVPVTHAERLKNVLFEAGAGHIGHYDECSFGTEGIGTFKADDQAHPFVGKPHVRHHEQELRLEVIVPLEKQNVVEKALITAHPYEEPAFDWIMLENKNTTAGIGIVGTLPQPQEATDFLRQLKETFHVKIIRHTETLNKIVGKVALCGGSGASLLPLAIAAQADIYITADVKYHEFFDANRQIIIADIGHYESEQFTKELLMEQLQKKLPNFVVHLSTINTNPIHYF
ncbi:MAG: Nif3-like dinuclear metal center hexameric protein [Microbacter sp.]